MKNGKKMRNIWKKLIVAILIFPCVFIFGGCSCSENNKTSKNTSKLTHTVMFYSGYEGKFNIPKQEVKDGGLVARPAETYNWYRKDSDGTLYKFGDWYSDASLDIQYLWLFDSDQVYSELTLYASWEIWKSNSN